MYFKGAVYLSLVNEYILDTLDRNCDANLIILKFLL